MLKARNILIILVVNYLIMIFVAMTIELWNIGVVAREVMTMMQIAGDAALEQVQATDDFFKSDKEYYIKVNKDGNFVKAPFFSTLLGIEEMVDQVENSVNIENSENQDQEDYGEDQNNNQENMELYYDTIENTVDNNIKSDVFYTLYNTDNFIQYAQKIMDVKMDLSYIDSMGNNKLYQVPKIVAIGLDVLEGLDINRYVTSEQGIVEPDMINKMFMDYGFLNAKHVIDDGNALFYTPISLGLTYIDPTLLNRVFMNNLDLLMRSKYARNGKDLNSVEGGNGFINMTYYKNDLQRNINSLNEFNPINNGKFVLLRGREVEEIAGIKMYSGIDPKIEYRVIDMYDSRNDELLKYLFNATANELKSLDVEGRNSKLIVVAKVTFYADIIVPYSMPFMKSLNVKTNRYPDNYGDIKHKNTTNVWGNSGNDCISYTRFFVVTY